MRVIVPLHPQWDSHRALWEWHLHKIFICRLFQQQFPRSAL